jgi:hypothetical protein
MQRDKKNNSNMNNFIDKLFRVIFFYLVTAKAGTVITLFYQTLNGGGNLSLVMI